MRKIKEWMQKHHLQTLVCAAWLTASFMGIEIFTRHYIGAAMNYPLYFSVVWAVMLTAIVLLLPRIAGKLLYAVVYFAMMAYGIAQAGYYLIFGKMMWLTDIVYASEGAAFANSVFAFLTKGFYISIVLMLVFGILGIWLIPSGKRSWKLRTACAAGIAVCCVVLAWLPGHIFRADQDIWGGDGEYRRALSLEGTYEVMYDARKLYNICGLYQYTMRDVYKHFIVPHTPAYEQELKENRELIDDYFEKRGDSGANEMTGLLKDKNVIVVLLESIDDWLITPEDTPHMYQMMQEGMQFTNMYTPGYGGVRTFNTEFCFNTGIFLPTDGNLAFSYCNNDFSQSMPYLFREKGYSAESFHYNQEIFYNRGVMHPAIGFEDYVGYYDYTTDKTELLHDNFPLDNEEVCNKLLGGDSESGRFFSFIISRSAHMPYTYDDELSVYALEQHPEYRGKNGHEELDCIEAKARLVDDLFAELKKKLAETGHLDDTAIVAFGDHYAYGFTDQATLKEKSGVNDMMLIEKTPFFIWSNDMQPVVVEKTLNTSDMLPTVLNLFGMKGNGSYLGQDAFDPNYEGYAIFANGGWITDEVLYRDGAVAHEFYPGAAKDADIEKMTVTAQEFMNISNLLLKCNYYAEKE